MNDKIRSWITSLSSSEAKELLSLLASEHGEILDQKELQKDLFCAYLAESGGKIKYALKASGLSYQQYSSWKQEEDFRTRLRLVFDDIISQLKQTAITKALNGDNDMIKFLLSGLEPDTWDSRVRAAKIQASAMIDAAKSGIREISQEDLRKLILEDPAQQFIPEPNTTTPDKSNTPI